MLASLILLSFAAPPQGDPVEVPSRLDRVTVYSGQAMVERVITVSADAPGPRSFRIGPLPMTADRESFQTRVQGQTAVLQGLEVRQRTGALDEGARAQLRDQIAALEAELRDLQQERLAIESGIGMLEAVVGSVNKEGLTGYAGMTLDDVFGFVTRQRAELDARQASYERNQQALEIEVRDLMKQLGGDASRARPYQEVDLNLFFQRAGTIEVRLLYLTNGASWEPVYDLRLDPELTSVDVGLVGRIYQNTDEDWGDVFVLLSTAQPQLGLDPPDLPRRWARVLESMNKRYRGVADAAPSSPAMELDKLADLGYLAESASEVRAGFALAPAVAVQDYGLSQQFALPERVSLASGTEPRQFRLVDVPLDVRPERYIVPSLSQQAYLRAEVTSESEAPLLPGTARVFLGPDYLGESSFPLLRQGDSTMLNLGLDPNVAVSYELVVDKQESPGVFSSKRSMMRIWETKLELSAAARGPVEILIEDVLPVAQDDRIKIKPYRMAQGALESEVDLKDREERGVWRWRIKLRPGEDSTLRWGYEAEFSEKVQPVIDQ